MNLYFYFQYLLLNLYQARQIELTPNRGFRVGWLMSVESPERKR